LGTVNNCRGSNSMILSFSSISNIYGRH
jgi:hypothetical protein